MLSAHTLARRAVTLAGARHQAVHDFGGFPQALYDLRYEVAGVPCLAPHVEQLLQWAGLEVEHADAAGLDHGIWVPLRDIRPLGDIPVLPVAFPPDWMYTPAMRLPEISLSSNVPRPSLWTHTPQSLPSRITLRRTTGSPPLCTATQEFEQPDISFSWPTHHHTSIRNTSDLSSDYDPSFR